MPSTNIPIRVVGLHLDGEKLLLDVEDVSDEEWSIEGTQEDLPAFKKLFGKTMAARLVIGAEEEQHAAAPVNDQAALTALEHELHATRARIAVLEEEAAARPSAVPGAVDANHPVVKLARGYLQVVVEDVTKHASAAKGGLSGHLYDIARQAKAGLAKIEELVGIPKANGKQAEAPAPAAS